MAAAGLNVVLISRTEAKLKEVADEISKYSINAFIRLSLHYV